MRRHEKVTFQIFLVQTQNGRWWKKLSTDAVLTVYIDCTFLTLTWPDPKTFAKVTVCAGTELLLCVA